LIEIKNNFDNPIEGFKEYTKWDEFVSWYPCFNLVYNWR
jgi:hypothetical protein